MKKISRFNGLNVRRGIYLEEDQSVVEGIMSLKPKIIFKKGIGEDNNGNKTIPIIFIGKFVHHIKYYTFEINVTLLTDEDKYINNIDNLEVFNDLAKELFKNFNKEDSKMRQIIYDQILKLQPYFTDVQNTDEFNLEHNKNISIPQSSGIDISETDGIITE